MCNKLISSDCYRVNKNRAGHVQTFFNPFVNGWLKSFKRPSFQLFVRSQLITDLYCIIRSFLKLSFVVNDLNLINDVNYVIQRYYLIKKRRKFRDDIQKQKNTLKQFKNSPLFSVSFMQF